MELVTEGMIEVWVEPSTLDADIVAIKELVVVVVVGFFVVRIGRVLGAAAADVVGMVFPVLLRTWFFLKF